MTPSATEFITPLTLQALSGHPVHTSLLDSEAEAGMGHIELARWADRILVAPASANFVARLVQGQADDLLTAICLATNAPIALAAAMNQGMWSNQATRDNVDQLKNRGIGIWGPAVGVQACGDVGPGRMLEVAELLERLASSFDTGLLAGLRVLITAGPTREAIDPVRYISNHSSGKMGFALAQAAIDAGAATTIVAGPVAIKPPDRLVDYVSVITALDMYDAVMDRIENTDIFISSAAVADFRPLAVAEKKLKKGDAQAMVLELTRNPDIVAAVAAREAKPFVVGFAAETSSVESYALDKLRKKNLDVIIANDVSQSGIGFSAEDNAVQVIWPADSRFFNKMSKAQLSVKLIELISNLRK